MVYRLVATIEEKPVALQQRKRDLVTPATDPDVMTDGRGHPGVSASATSS